MDTVDNAITKPVHRLEVFTGAGRRRSFSDEDKARIVAEIVTSGDFCFRRGETTWIVATAVVWLAAASAQSPRLRFLRQTRLRFVPAVVDVAIVGSVQFAANAKSRSARMSLVPERSRLRSTA